MHNDSNIISIGKPEQSFTLWQQATVEFPRREHSIIACSCHIYMGVVLRAHSVRGEPRIQRNASGVIATRAGLKPMQLHWALRHGVWADCSFLADTPCA